MSQASASLLPAGVEREEQEAVEEAVERFRRYHRVGAECLAQEGKWTVKSSSPGFYRETCPSSIRPAGTCRVSTIRSCSSGSPGGVGRAIPLLRPH
jgi:hypothetical protein